MFWPGMGNPRKRKETIRFLIISAIVGVSVAAGVSLLGQELSKNDPLKVCINDRETPYQIQATLEVIVDRKKAEIPAMIGFDDGCQRSLYTTTGDGTIHAEWEEEYPFEIGHFLWAWDFPLRDMIEAESRILVDGRVADEFIRAPLIDGAHYTAEFTSKQYDSSKDTDFLPPDA